LSDGLLDAALFEEEALMDGHALERIGYLAIDSLYGSVTTIDGRRVQVFFDQLDHLLSPRPYPLPSSHRHPSVLADIITTDGADPVTLRYANPDATQIELQLSEEQSKDTETNHVPEEIGVFVGE
jgi:hypothetical protein